MHGPGALLTLIAAHPCTPRVVRERLERDHATRIDVIAGLLRNPQTTHADIVRIISVATNTYRDITELVNAALSRPALPIRTGRAIVNAALPDGRAPGWMSWTNKHPLSAFDELPATIHPQIMGYLLDRFVRTATTQTVCANAIELLTQPHLRATTRTRVIRAIVDDSPRYCRTRRHLVSVGCALLHDPARARVAAHRARRAGWSEYSVWFIQVIADAYKAGHAYTLDEYARATGGDMLQRKRGVPPAFMSAVDVAVATAEPSWIEAALTHPTLTSPFERARRAYHREDLMALAGKRRLPTRHAATLLLAIDEGTSPTLTVAHKDFIEHATTEELNTYLAATRFTEALKFAMRRTDHTTDNVERTALLTGSDGASDGVLAWAATHPNAPGNVYGTGSLIVLKSLRQLTFTVKEEAGRGGAVAAGAALPQHLSPAGMGVANTLADALPALVAHANAYLATVLPELRTHEQITTLFAMMEQLDGTLGELFTTTLTVAG